ncbi:trafficking protein particle complex subunit 1 [Folsomia candida]|uniref:Trafficking protein particle complex subunit n=1 Tax=Folsomia candida TaxID=158441 RepID=A0A226EUK3_FOLCA|nr:trafficking protein particle complex subunit 1 [Folsomia candida]OXA60837.1 Trafficking protein particle complex subunit 1 [Folsomia candida]
MTIHNLYIFDRQGTLVYYGEWNRKKPGTMSREEEGKLVYGMLFSLRSFLDKISPLDMNDNSFLYRTTKYKMNYWESPTGVKFLMNTDLNAPNIKELLRTIYQQVFVEYVVKNPVLAIGAYIDSELFIQKLDELIKSSLSYTSKV